MNNLQTLWANPHLRYSVCVLALLEIAAIWLPSYKEQLSATGKIVQFYAIAAAANSTPQRPDVSTPPTPPAPPAQPKGQNEVQ